MAEVDPETQAKHARLKVLQDELAAASLRLVKAVNPVRQVCAGCLLALLYLSWSCAYVMQRYHPYHPASGRRTHGIVCITITLVATHTCLESLAPPPPSVSLSFSLVLYCTGPCEGRGGGQAKGSGPRQGGAGHPVEVQHRSS